MKKYVGLGGRGSREKPPAPASPLGASSNPLGKPGTWGEGVQGASGDPPTALGLGSPPLLLAAAVPGQDGSAAPPQHPAPPLQHPGTLRCPGPLPAAHPAAALGVKAVFLAPSLCNLWPGRGALHHPVPPLSLPSSLQGQEKVAGSWCSAPPNHSPAQQAGEGREEITGGGGLVEVPGVGDH